jgi:predicted nucleic acid-binding protein
MPAPDFLDTNVLLYAYDPSDRRKLLIAHNLLRKAVAGHKISPPAAPKQVTAILDALAPIRVILPDGDMVRPAVEAHAEYGVRFYDGMILAAAERGRCQRIWSEDFNAGQRYFGIVVENPFKDAR